MSSPSRPRWRPRFSLGGLFLLLAVLACAMGWAVMLFEEYRREYEAASFLIDERNAVTNTSLYDTEISGQLPRINPRNPSLRKIHLSVHFVKFEGVTIDEPVWEALHRLKGLDRLYIVNCQIQSRNGDFARLRGLESLLIHDSELTARDMREIASLDRLRDLNFDSVGNFETLPLEFQNTSPLMWLHVSNMHISRETLSHVSHAIQLQELVLRQCTIGQGAISKIVDMQNLEILELGESRFEGDALTGIARLPELRLLHLYDTNISDVDLRDVAECDQLIQVTLTGTPISDVGLRHLTDLPKLEILMIGNTAVTNGGLEPLSRFKKLNWDYLEIEGTAIDELELAKFRGPRP